MVEKLLQVDSISRSFGDLQAVKDLTLQVRGGEIFGLMGPDGAGKTTLMRMICGAILPDSGQVTVNGTDMLRSPDKAREGLGYLSQRFSLYEDLTVLENLRFFAEVRGFVAKDWQPRTLEILEFVGLAEFVDRRAGKLSGGMRQKLGLATALVHRPRLLLLDEPTGGVDPVTRQDFWQLLIRLVREENVGVLVSTPYMDEAVRCTYVGMMVAGELVLEGSPDQLLQEIQGQVLEVRGSPLASWRQVAGQLPEVQDAQIFGNRLHLRVIPGKMRTVIRSLKRAASQPALDLTQISVVDPILDDVFIEVLSRQIESSGLPANSGGQNG
jgi:ABC-2 type transport system ATP-binding protein